VATVVIAVVETTTLTVVVPTVVVVAVSVIPVAMIVAVVVMSTMAVVMAVVSTMVSMMTAVIAGFSGSGEGEASCESQSDKCFGCVFHRSLPFQKSGLVLLNTLPSERTRELLQPFAEKTPKFARCGQNHKKYRGQ